MAHGNLEIEKMLEEEGFKWSRGDGWFRKPGSKVAVNVSECHTVFISGGAITFTVKNSKLDQGTLKSLI